MEVITSMMLIFSYPCMIYIVGKLLPSAFRIYGHLKIIWRSATFRWPSNDLWGHQLQVPQSVVFVVLVVLVSIFSKRLMVQFLGCSFRIFSNFNMLTSSQLINYLPPLRKVNDLQMTFKWPLRPPTTSTQNVGTLGTLVTF